MLTAAVPVDSVVTGVVDVEFDTRDGLTLLPLERCAAFPFELQGSPVRSFPSFRGQRNFPGLWWFATTGTHVGHESWTERDQLMALDADPDVVGVLSQPFWLHWRDGKRHAPDYFVRNRDGSAVVIDVRDDARYRRPIRTCSIAQLWPVTRLAGATSGLVRSILFCDRIFGGCRVIAILVCCAPLWPISLSRSSPGYGP